ncbi:MAG: hypothetical protein GX621_06535, partial [Pirellulaceae bacterium]|nr:hypothetical protein [Pirellulaceae bacterium]
LCGTRFEDLFPGLGSYGANRQIAWMMWHGAADRRLPEIGRVLEGVPDDLAKVINRLVAKDQTIRYKSATEALADLRADAGEIEPPPPTADAEQEAARQAAAKKKRQRRVIAAAALLCSLLVCVVLLLPSPEPPPVKPAEPPQGVVRQVYLLEKTITLETDDGKPLEVRLRGETTVAINDQPGLVRDLREGDHVLVNTYRKESGQLVTELRVTRPEANQGRIVLVEPGEGRFEFLIDGQPDRRLSIAVPADLEIRLNGKTTLDGRAVALADLKPDDRVTVHHLAGEAESRRATELAVSRVVSTEGVLRELDAAKGTLTFALGDEADAAMETLPLRPDCEVTINDRGVLDERRLRPADLRPGDQLKIMHDDRISRIDAYRVLGQKGVVSRIRLADRQVEATMEDGAKRMTLLVGDETRISLGGRTVELGELRPGDEIEVTHDSPDARMPELLTLAATRPVDRRRWAALVSVENYEDASVAPLPHARADAALVRGALGERFQVPEDQIYSLDDPSLVQLEQGLDAFLRRVPSDAKLVVYFVGHAFVADDGKAYLAPKNFHRGRTASSGLALQWLVDRLESCRAKEKLLLLDCSHAGDDKQIAGQPSVEEMIATLDSLPGRVPFQTVTVLTSSSKGERGFALSD